MFDNLKIQDYQSLYDVRKNTKEYSYLTLYLNFVKTYLKSKSLGLQEGAETINKFAVHSNQTIFYLPYFSSLDSLIYKTEDEEEELVLDTDYIKQGKKGLYFNEIRLLKYCNVFSGQNRLKITANWGFETIPSDLHFVFLNIFSELLGLIKKQAEMIQNNGKELSSLRIDEITYNFANGSRNAKITDLKTIFNNSQDLKSLIHSYV